MPLAARVLLFLLPKNEKTVGLLIALLLIPVLFMFFLGSAAVFLTNVPAIEPKQIQTYKDITVETFAEFDIMVPWKELVAIDAVRFQQDFSKASKPSIRELAKRFLKKVERRDKDGNVIVYYVLKPLEVVVAEMIASGELVEGDLERIQNYLRLPWDSAAETPELPGGYIPIPGGAGLVFPVVGQWHVSDVFRDRFNPVTGHREKHKGIDLASPEGTPVVAAKPGRVTVAKFNGSAGNEVKIDHGDGTVTRYLHLYSFSVHSGQTVEAGEPIARVGSTGQSTGPHLHFELYIRGTPVDPAPYLFE